MLYFLAGGLLGLLLAVLVWITRYSDATVAERMASSKRVDGKNDPRAYQHHSSY